MNNRNQTQTDRAPAPAATLTYLNVFTVEEYESNGSSCDLIGTSETQILMANL